MSSGNPSRGPFGLAAQLPYHHLSSASSSDGGDILKRSLTKHERQRQIYHALFQRTVKQRTSPAATSASCSTATAFLMPDKSTIRNRLEELERQLLDDDDASVPESAITVTQWSETMQQLISPPPLLSSPSPTTSSSSTASSSSGTAATPSRQLLLDTATAVADGYMETATANLAILKRAANPRGDPEQRLTAMMVSALLSRINPGQPVLGPEGRGGAQHLFDLCPCFKLGLLAANLAILDATRVANKVHILDFDVGQGGQHAALVRAIAERHRHRRPPAVKITAVSDPASGDCDGLKAVGDRIARLAEGMGVGLRFSILRLHPSELDAAAVGCEPGEALSVNLAFQLSRVADESVSPANPRDELIRRVRGMRPRVVALVEQEVNGNTAPFGARFAEACGHYGALLEALEATAGRESEERERAEAWLGGRAGNSVAREGAERVERCEVFGKWRARMGMAGLRPVPLGPAVVEPVRARLASLRGNPGFTVREEAGGLCFGWMGRVITVASTWR